MCLTRNLIMRIETNFKEDLFKEELVEKYIFVLTPNPNDLQRLQMCSLLRLID